MIEKFLKKRFERHGVVFAFRRATNQNGELALISAAGYVQLYVWFDQETEPRLIRTWPGYLDLGAKRAGIAEFELLARFGGAS